MRFGSRCGLTATTATTLTAAALAAPTALATSGAGREHLNRLRGDGTVLAGRSLHHHPRPGREVRASAGRGLAATRSPLLNIGLLGELDCDGAALGGDRQRVAGQGLDRPNGAAAPSLTACTTGTATLSCPGRRAAGGCRAGALPGLAAGSLLRCLPSGTPPSRLAASSELPAAGRCTSTGRLGLRRLVAGKQLRRPRAEGAKTGPSDKADDSGDSDPSTILELETRHGVMSFLTCVRLLRPTGLLVAQRLNRIEAGGAQCGIDAKEQPNGRRDDEGQDDGLWRDDRLEGLAGTTWGGQLYTTEQARSTNPDSNTNTAAEQAHHGGLNEKLHQDIASFGAERLADTDFARALGHRHQHDVHDPDTADQQRDTGPPLPRRA